MRFRNAFPETWSAAALPADDELARRAVAAWRTPAEDELDDSVCFRVGTLWPLVMICEVRAPGHRHGNRGTARRRRIADRARGEAHEDARGERGQP